ncbi:MAG: hypothetical protein K0R12_434 [Gammaproteobacteria bacterium]|jgi:hypothetical protein|nr:hypothetical protein [Gammaproteobacteria bacterium]
MGDHKMKDKYSSKISPKRKELTVEIPSKKIRSNVLEKKQKSIKQCKRNISVFLNKDEPWFAPTIVVLKELKN